MTQQPPIAETVTVQVERKHLERIERLLPDAELSGHITLCRLIRWHVLAPALACRTCGGCGYLENQHNDTRTQCPECEWRENATRRVQAPQGPSHD